MRIFHCSLIVAVAALGGVAAEPQADEVKKALAPLQGKWTLASIEAKGMSTPAEQLPQGLVVISGDEIYANEANFKFKFRLRVHPDTQPLALDLENEPKGKMKDVQEGICAVEGDLLKICLCATPNLRERPADFVTQADNNSVLFVLKRSRP